MLWVKWPHETTRPLSDGTVDPHLHRHVTAINVSYDSVEKVYKATQFGNIVRDKGYYQAAYHARLAEKLSGLGYGVEREQKSFRLMGIEKATLEKFSRRTSVIEEKAKALGITDRMRRQTSAGKPVIEKVTSWGAINLRSSGSRALPRQS